MERKVIKKSTIKNQNYINILIKLYLQVYQALECLIKTTSNLTAQFKNILSCPKKSGGAERQVKRLNQIKLFTQTLELIQNCVKKEHQVNKSDVIINFDIISKIILNRINQFFYLTGEEIKGIEKDIECLKQNIFIWSRQLTKKNGKRAKTNHSTTNYSIQYVFSQISTNYNTNNTSYITKSTTNNILINDNKYKQLIQPIVQQTNHQTPQNFAEFASQQNRGNAIIQQQKRKTYDRRSRNRFYFTTIDRFNRPPSSIKRKTYNKNTILTPNLKKNHNKDFQIESQLQSTLNIGVPQDKQFQEENQEQIVQSSLKNSIKQPIFHNVSLKQITQQNEQQKKLDFYLSQNYLKSKKYIENITLLSTKIKRRDSNVRLSHSKRPSNNIFKEIQQNQISYGRYAPLGQKYARNNNNKKKTFINGQSEQISRNASTFSTLRNSDKNVQQLTTVHKDKDHKKASKYKMKNYSKIKNEKVCKRLQQQQQLKKKYLMNQNGIIAPLIQQLIPEPKIYQQKLITTNLSLKHFYDELNGIQQQIIVPKDSYYKDFSNFFNIQNILAQQQNKKMQLILQNQYNRIKPYEFDINCSKSKRANIYFQYQKSEKNLPADKRRSDELIIGQIQMNKRTSIIQLQ